MIFPFDLHTESEKAKESETRDAPSSIRSGEEPRGGPKAGLRGQELEALSPDPNPGVSASSYRKAGVLEMGAVEVENRKTLYASSYLDGYYTFHIKLTVT
ncbi:hypothetical protein N7541_009829 [Penicillium brevicompactum]|uniref:Uncharacterized protein n=1 Tax=Penicillium brevicompactum TaxID=5074 RepID=A0A9W9QNS4_PENBR|nr:hypothetical protein N7541_009829 [Penicillium brevicompactum]